MLQFIFRSVIATAVIAGAKKLYDAFGARAKPAFVVHVSGGRVSSVEGQQLSASRISDCNEICQTFGIDGGTITKLVTDSCTSLDFTSDIPAASHQRFRNVLLN